MKNEFSPFSAEWCLQLQNNPIVVALRPTAFGLPPIAHVYPSAREDEVRTNPEMLIRNAKHAPTSEDMREIERYICRLYWNDIAICPEASLDLLHLV